MDYKKQKLINSKNYSGPLFKSHISKLGLVGVPLPAENRYCSFFVTAIALISSA
jgi:hypothetical protein